MTHVTRRLTAKNRDQPRNRTLGNRVWATFIFLPCTCLFASCAVWAAVWTGIAEHADVVVSTSLFPLFTALLIIFIILFCMLCVELAAYRRSVYWHCPRGVRGRVYETVRCPSVCLSQRGVTAANPLLQVCCCRPGEEEISIGCCSSAVRWANAGSATLSAYVGSWT